MTCRPRKKQKSRFRSDKKKSKKSSLSTSSIHDDVWSVKSSGKSKKNNDLSSFSSVPKQRKDRAPRLKMLRPMQGSFKKTVDHRSYCLKNKSPWYNSKIASKFARLDGKWKSQLKETDFYEMNPILILVSIKDDSDFL